MLKECMHSIRMLLIMTVVLGLGYPLVMTGFAQVVFPEQANGSLIYANGQAVGSKWIGQNFTGDQYFHGRPSSAGKDGYDGAGSSGSNLGPTSEKLLTGIDALAKDIRVQNGLAVDAKVPSDLVTASGSGLDPHITPAAAAIQIERIAAARDLGSDAVKKVLAEYTEAPQAGILGDERVNVLLVNVALDQLNK